MGSVGGACGCGTPVALQRGVNPPICKDADVQAIIAVAMEGRLSEEQAERLAGLEAELLKLVLLAAARQIAEQNGRIAEQQARIAELESKLAAARAVSPSTPSGQIPVYQKPAAPKGRKGKPGAKPGHQGARRARPERPDRQEEHRLEVCPDCGGPLQRCNRTRSRVIEDLPPQQVHTEAVEHIIHRDYCPRCKKHVEPVVPDALPNATIGHRLVVLAAWWHYGLGVTIAQILSILVYHLHTRLTAGGLVAMWQKLAEILTSWYEQIVQEARKAGVLHADETGWRVLGHTWWLWCFVSQEVCCYVIDRCRGSPVLQRFFIEAFGGVLVRDFWAPYNAVCAEDHQCCLVHLLRELEKVDEHNRSGEWAAFAKKLRRLLRDGIRLRKRPDYSRQKYASRVGLLDRRLMELARDTYADADARRLAARLLKHCDSIFTFLDYPDVPFDNNYAERMIRPAVMLRRNSQCNRSEKGAAAQAVLMSVYQTLKLRNHDPLTTITEALRTYVTTGKLPPLPASIAANG